MKKLLSLLLISCLLFSGLTTTVSAKKRAEGDKPPPPVRLPYEFRVYLKWMLNGVHASDEVKIATYDEARGYLLSYLSQEPSLHVVNSVEEGITLDHRNLPFYQHRQYEMVHLREAPPLEPAELKGATPEIQAALDEYEEKQIELVDELIEFILSGENPFTKVLASLNRIVFKNKGEAQKFLKFILETELTSEMKLEIVNRFEAYVLKQINNFDELAEEIAKDSEVDEKLKSTQRFMEIVLKEYFEQLPEKNKLDMVSDIFDNPDMKDPLEVFQIMVLNSGAILQKTFQVIGRKKGIPDGMASVFQILESSGKATPFPMVRAIIDSDPTQAKEIEWISETPVGVGTVAQVHFATVSKKTVSNSLLPHTDVVVRVLKPGVKEGIETDHEVLKEVAKKTDSDPVLIKANFPKLGQIIDEIRINTLSDLDLDGTYERQLLGEENYNRTFEVSTEAGSLSIEFRVPKILPKHPNTSYLVMERVRGSKFNPFTKENPEEAQKLALELHKLWIETAVFLSGFGHHDLHQGNLLIEAFPKNKEITVSLLDFGMSGFLSKKEQSGFIALYAAAYLEAPKTIAKILWDLSVQNQNAITLKELRYGLTEMVKENAKENKKKAALRNYLLWASDHGIKFPDSWIGFNRGRATVQLLLEDAGVDPKVSNEASMTVSKKHWGKVSWALMKYGILFSFDSFSIIGTKTIRFKNWVMGKEPIRSASPFTVSPQSKCLGFLSPSVLP